MTKGEKLLSFAAQALGGATLFGLLLQSTDIRFLEDITRQKMTALLILSVAALLLLALLAKLLLRVRCLPALGKMAMAYLSGVVMGLAMAALVLLLAEMNTAFTSMLILISHGGQ